MLAILILISMWETIWSAAKVRSLDIDIMAGLLNQLCKPNPS